jgi:hypothetical protein
MAYKQVVPKCSEPDCPSQRYCKGLCKAHYRRLIGELSSPVKHYARNKGAACRLACDKPAYARSLCKAHYHRLLSGKADWYGKLRTRIPAGALAMGRVWVRGKYADMFCKLAEARGMTLNELASNLLEEYAQARLAGRLDDRRADF